MRPPLIADLMGGKDVSMLLVLDKFRIAHVTTHVSLGEVMKIIKKPRVLEVIALTTEFLRLNGLIRPRIGVVGLNPHAGDCGFFGREDIQEIRPAVEQAVTLNIGAEGPLVPDNAFCQSSITIRVTFPLS